MSRRADRLAESDVVPEASIWIASTFDALGLDGARMPASAEERSRADRFRQAADRERFLAGRALARHALSQAVDDSIGLESWQFEIDPNGKPMVAGDLPRIAFNLSHSGSCVAVAVGAAAAIGVDVECALPDERLAIVPDVLTAREQDALRLALPQDRWGSFIRLWTVKEACGKALGLGLGIEFTTFDVDLDALVVEIRDGALEPGHAFSVAARHLSCAGRPYCVSVAVVGDRSASTSFRFKPLGRASILG